MLQVLLALGALCAVLGAGLHTAGDALGIQSTADDVVTDAGEIPDTATADHNDGVLLQGVAHAGNVSGDFVAVGQTHTGDLTQSGVGLLGGRRSDGRADAALLRGAEISLLVLQRVQALLHSGRIGLVSALLPALLDQLVKSRHLVSPFVRFVGHSLKSPAH